MDQIYLEEFKSMLTRQLDGLLNQANDTVSGFTKDFDKSPDPLDRASDELNRNYTIRIRDRESRLIKKIDMALKRIEKGIFGICDECEEEISIERLRARPVTTKCITCKQKEEKKESLMGI